MSPSKVYIQIPHFNNAPFIEDCIRSVNELTYPNLDIHFFDDHSNDNTQDIINKFSESKLTFHKNIERLGRVKNYQKAFSYHKDADWFINLDSDDYYTSPNWINDAMQLAENNPSDNIVHVQANLLAYISKKKINPIKTYDNGFYLISGQDYMEICIQHYCFSHLGSIFNVEKVKESGAYIDDCMHTDFFTAMRVALRGNVLVGSIQIGVWREHHSNQSEQRYNPDETNKNSVAYSRFFEYCEDFLSYSKLKTIVDIYENRELENSMSISLKTNGIYSEFKKLNIENQFNLYTFFLLLKLNFKNIFIESPTIKNIFNGIITKLISVFILFFSLPLLIKYLGVINYSWVGLYTTLISSMYIFDFGLTNIITKELTQSDKYSLELKQKYSTLEIIYLIIGFFVFCCLIIASPLIGDYVFINDQITQINRNNIIKLISLALLVQWPHSFYTGVLFGLGRQVLANNLQLGMTILKYGGAIALLMFFGGDIYLFFYWQIAISIITILLFKLIIFREINLINPVNNFSISSISKIKKLAAGISIIGIFGFVYSDLINLYLAKIMSADNYAYNSILLTIIGGILSYCMTIKNAIFPSISKLVLHDSKDHIYSIYIKYLKIISFSLVPITIFLASFSYSILKLWLADLTIINSIDVSFDFILFGCLFNALMLVPVLFLIAKSQTKYLVIQAGILALIAFPFLIYLMQDGDQVLNASLFWFYMNFIPCIFMHIYFNFIFNKLFSKAYLIALLIPVLISLGFLSLYTLLTNLIRLSLFFNFVAFCIVLFFTYLTLFFIEFNNSKKVTNT